MKFVSVATLALVAASAVVAFPDADPKADPIALAYAEAIAEPAAEPAANPQGPEVGTQGGWMWNSETLPAPEPKRLRMDDDDHGEHDEHAMVRLGPQQADTGAMDVNTFLEGASKGASKWDREMGARQASPKGHKKGPGGQQLGMDESPDGFVDLSSDYGTVVGDCTNVATIALHSNFSGSLTPPYTDMSSIGSPSELFESQVWKNRYNEWQPIICDFSMDAELGNGRSGVVCKAMYNGSPVALKLCSANSEWDIIDEMYNEVKVYKHLESLQGDCIPRLLMQGLVTYENMLYVAIVFELIEEAPELHARMFNVLFEAADGELKPRIIDFAFSKVDASCYGRNMTSAIC
ncbi:hypothetical protein GGI07_004856 [Coemansia sp. Benny D115]|nr:hypothetical protein GGI07_004856 [Coemansia sp. Benny D115]